MESTPSPRRQLDRIAAELDAIEAQAIEIGKAAAEFARRADQPDIAEQLARVTAEIATKAEARR